MLPSSTSSPSVIDTRYSFIIYMIKDIYVCIIYLSIISICIFVRLLRLYYSWYIALPVELRPEKMKGEGRERKMEGELREWNGEIREWTKETTEWKKEIREQAKQQRELAEQGRARLWREKL